MDIPMSVRMAISLLRSPNVTTTSKLKNCTVIRDYLDGTAKKCLAVQNIDVMKEIFQLANLEVTTQDSELQQVVFAILNLLLKCNITYKIINEIPSVYLRLAFDANLNCSEVVQTAAYDCLNSCLKLIITNNICDVQPLFLKLADKSINNKVSNLLCNVYSDLPVELSVVFFYEKNICAMFESPHIDVRYGLIQINNRLLPKFKISLLNNDDLDKYKTSVRRSYVPRIVELMNSKDINWSNLFKFILRCFGKLLHTQVDLINDLLKAVESAFRSFNLEDRFQAFECWKELIDNYSLDMNRLCGAKQMKLLITPLRTNISTNDLIVYKRFEVWVHLFNILQDKAFVCLEKFLLFCFGTSAGGSPNIQNLDGCSQNTQLYEGSTQALLEILGHYQHKNMCFQFSKLFLILNKPLVNDDNFVNVESSVVHSVAKCSIIILRCVDAIHVTEVIRCLWGSLFNKIKNVDEERQEQILKNVVTKLQSYIQCTNSNENFRCILMPILRLLINENFFSKQMFTETIFFPLIKCLLDNRVSISLTDNNIISEFIKYVKDFYDIEKWLEQAYNILSNSNTNFHNALILWMTCTDFVFYLTKSVTQRFQELIVDFMVWPLSNKDISTPPLNLDFIRKWRSTIRYMSKIIPLQCLAIMEKLRSILSQENAFVICLFYKAFCQMLENDHINGFEAVLLNLTQHMLESFPLKKSDASLLLPAVILFLQHMASGSDTSNFISLCNCCAILLIPYKKYKLLNTLEETIGKIQLPIPATLIAAIASIKGFSEEKVPLKLENAVQSLNKNVKAEKPFPRGRKLTTLATQKISNTSGESSSLLLLGQNVSSPNHVGIRGSHLKDEINMRSKKIVNKLNSSKNVIIEDDETMYVPIHTEYNFDSKKMTEHQLEVLKTLQSDIPALYQDLSQSQSNFKLLNSNENLIDLNSDSKKDLDVSEECKLNNTSSTSQVKTNSNEERVNLCVQNPSEKQIDAMIRRRDSIDSLKEIGIDDQKKRERVEKELIKLKLDVVGGEFVQNIDLLGKRETRHKSDQNFKQYKFLKVVDSSPDKRSGTPTESTSKRVRGSERKILHSPSKRRTSVAKDLSKVKDNVNKSLINSEDKHFETPKGKREIGRRRKSVNPLQKKTPEENDLNKAENGEKFLISSDDNLRTKQLETPKQGNGKRGRPKNIVSSSLKKSNSDDENLNKVEDDVKKCLMNVDNRTPEVQSKSEKVRSRKSVNSPTTKTSVKENLNKVEDDVKKSSINLENNLKESQSEDVIESSQKLQHVDNNNSNVINVLNSEFEEIVSRISKLQSETVEPVGPEVIKDNIDLTDEKQETCDMETETIDLCDDVGTPNAVINIPTSPIEIDTPTRTSEFLNNTVDISPIKLLEDSQKTQELFESETINIIPLKKDENVQEQVQQNVSANDIQLTFFNRRLKKIPSSKSFASIKRMNKIITSPVIFSAQTHRIMKMMQKCEKKLEFHKQVNEDPPPENVSDDVNPNQEFLKFVRELPSPKASPRCSILKRKACEFIDEGLSPPRKKRVNFPDPPLTSKVMYLPDVNEYSHVAVDPITLFDDADDPEDSEEIAFSEETQLLNTVSQGSVKLVDVQLLNSCDPVFKDLVDCEDDIGDIVMSLSDPVFAPTLLNELQAKNIKTVGDLARLSEIDVNRLPIKSPKLTNLVDVLSKHQLQNSIKEKMDERLEHDKNDAVQTNNEVNKPDIVQRKQKRRVPLKTLTDSDCVNGSNFTPLLLEPVLPNIKTEIEAEGTLNKLIEELDSIKLLAKRKRVNLTALFKLLTEIMEPNQLVQILQDNTAFRLSSLIEEKDWPKILKEVITTISLKKFVALLCSIPAISPTNILQMLIDESIPKYNNNNFSEVGQHICRVIESSSPSVILKHLSLERIIKETFHKCNDSKLSTSDFFKDAFRVFAPTMDDIIPSFQYINIVNLQNQSIQRNEEDLFTFIQRILTIVDTSKVCLLIPKEKMLPLFTKEELVDSFVKISTSPCGIVQTCEILVRELPKAKPTDNIYESLIFSLFDKIPTSDLCRYFSRHLNRFADTVQNTEQM